MRGSVASLAWACVLGFFPGARAQDRIEVQENTQEAEVVLRIVDAHVAGRPIPSGDWRALLESEPYTRLKRREASFQAAFSDDDFKAFVLSQELARRGAALRHALEERKKADLPDSGRRILPYLPKTARIRAKVFIVIKPRENSFVFEADKDPTIFLSLNPGVSQAKFENTVAHEMHHIGFASVDAELSDESRDLEPPAKAAVGWMGAFGEGFAMLAAAGGPEIHPHAHSAPSDRARWDADMARFPEDLAMLDRFFLDLVRGKMGKAQVDREGASFFGVQGPWYTVGYKMAVVVEERYGRPALVDCMTHIRTFIPRYNQAAAEASPPLPMFSGELVAAIAPRSSN